ncbi:MAG: DAK2 domain-containing protein, partial [Candidatus Ratteibacteria bacterium]
LMTLKETLEYSHKDDLENFLKNISKNIVLKAHGNSGIIFSSFLKGFLYEILNFDCDELKVLERAFESGLKESYKILDNPIEGTILTVIKESAKGIKEGEDLKDGVKKAYIYGVEALEKTPELLPSLKEAGVVDAGGEGFLSFLESLYEVFIGVNIIREKVSSSFFDVSIWRKRPKYKYCVEVIVERKNEYFGFKDELKKMGDSIIFVEDNEKIKIHIHTNKLDEFSKLINKIGEIKDINIRNMRKQQLEFLLDVEIAIITFSIGENIKDLFYSLGASIVIDKDEKSFDKLIDFNGKTILGDALDIDVLKDAEIEKSDAIAILTSNDNANIVIGQIAKKIFNVPKVIIRISDPNKEKICKLLDLETINTTTLLASLIKEGLTKRISSRYLFENEDFAIVELKSENFIGKKIEEINIDGKLSVFAIIRGNKGIVPDKKLKIEKDDIIIGIIEKKNLNKFKRILKE